MRDFDVSKSLRTDLAQETLEQLYEQNGRKISGLLSQNSRKNGFDIHTLRVSDKTGEAASGKKGGGTDPEDERRKRSAGKRCVD